MTKLTSARPSVVLVAVAATLSLVACGGDDAEPSRTQSTSDVTVADDAGGPLDGTWRVVAGVVDGEAITLVPGREVTFDVDGREIGGTAACNAYGGRADIGAGTIAIGELSWTEMGCEPAVMELEQVYLRSLQTIESWSVTDGRLSLTGPSSTWTLEVVAPVPTAALTGTTWVLDTYLDGETATHSAAMDGATLILDADGTLSGSTGCRLLEGTWVESGAEIVLPELAAIDDPAAGVCAPEAEDLDGRIVSVLGDGFRVDIDGDRLTVVSAGGEGLSFRAGDPDDI